MSYAFALVPEEQVRVEAIRRTLYLRGHDTQLRDLDAVLTRLATSTAPTSHAVNGCGNCCFREEATDGHFYCKHLAREFQQPGGGPQQLRFDDTTITLEQLENARAVVGAPDHCPLRRGGILVTLHELSSPYDSIQ